jgi:hypothetical protein
MKKDAHGAKNARKIAHGFAVVEAKAKASRFQKDPHSAEIARWAEGWRLRFENRAEQLEKEKGPESLPLFPV